MQNMPRPHESSVISVESAPHYAISFALDVYKRTKTSPSPSFSRKMLISILLFILLALSAALVGLYFWLSRSSYQSSAGFTLTYSIDNGSLPYVSPQSSNQTYPPTTEPISIPSLNASTPPSSDTAARWCWFFCWSPSYPPSSPPSPPPPPPPPPPCPSGTFSSTGNDPCSQSLRQLLLNHRPLRSNRQLLNRLLLLRRRSFRFLHHLSCRQLLSLPCNAKRNAMPRKRQILSIHRPDSSHLLHARHVLLRHRLDCSIGQLRIRLIQQRRCCSGSLYEVPCGAVPGYGSAGILQGMPSRRFLHW